MVWPIDYHKLPTQLEIIPAKPVVIIAHGLNSSPPQWSDELKRNIEQANPQHQVFAIDWRPYSANTLRCSVDGKRIGRQLASHFIDKQIPSVELIGHSCGSFVILGICEALREQQQPMTIHSTYLDPVSVYGGMWSNYGISHFGQCADFSDAYIDTRDGVPGSDQALEYAYTFDVSALAKPAQYSGSPHQWPIFYFQQRVREQQVMTKQHRQHIINYYSKNTLIQPSHD